MRIAMISVRRRLALVVLPATLAAGPVYPDIGVEAGIDRNLQERGGRAFELQMGLDAAPLPIPLSEEETRRSVALPPRIVDLYERPPPDRASPRPRSSDSVGRSDFSLAPSALVESQRRRQLGLQAQTHQLPDTQRRRALDSQQLQFERELQSQRLHSEIMRHSGRPLRR